ncbi:MAG: hypothetical protein HC916_11130 [Coleofasciculaceae cyanobacterium SM2_1_6]|nr:hypothetical protein [Coleofasciculaceae cyanobacterium SM2_1_6]
MKSSNNSNWQQRLQELEAEVNQSSGQTSTPNNGQNNNAESTPGNYTSYTIPEELKAMTNPTRYQPFLDRTLVWFKALPQVGKIAVVVVGAFVTFSVLRSVLQLVAAIASLAILGILLYLGYKFLVATQVTDE